jgi:hypothetical protein
MTTCPGSFASFARSSFSIISLCPFLDTHLREAVFA